MRQEYNLYCDESCHLHHDGINVMLLGAIWCRMESKDQIFKSIREIKLRHGLSPSFEIKWNKVSASKVVFYLELIDYFFDNEELHFRALVVTDKKSLDHEFFNQDHDTFYYKMYFDLIKVILLPACTFNIYLDIKDTRSQQKVNKLHEVLCNSQYDFKSQIIRKIQQVRSHEVALIQITDLLIGALAYLHRGLSENQAKKEIIERIRLRSGYSLLKTTLLKEEKMNVFVWKPSTTNHG